MEPSDWNPFTQLFRAGLLPLTIAADPDESSAQGETINMSMDHRINAYALVA
jgi:hypothetical protein